MNKDRMSKLNSLMVKSAQVAGEGRYSLMEFSYWLFKNCEDLLNEKDKMPQDFPARDSLIREVGQIKDQVVALRSSKVNVDKALSEYNKSTQEGTQSTASRDAASKFLSAFNSFNTSLSSLQLLQPGLQDMEKKLVGYGIAGALGVGLDSNQRRLVSEISSNLYFTIKKAIAYIDQYEKLALNAQAMLSATPATPAPAPSATAPSKKPSLPSRKVYNLQKAFADFHKSNPEFFTKRVGKENKMWYDSVFAANNMNFKSVDEIVRDNLDNVMGPKTKAIAALVGSMMPSTLAQYPELQKAYYAFIGRSEKDDAFTKEEEFVNPEPEPQTPEAAPVTTTASFRRTTNMVKVANNLYRKYN